MPTSGSRSTSRRRRSPPSPRRRSGSRRASPARRGSGSLRRSPSPVDRRSRSSPRQGGGRSGSRNCSRSRRSPPLRKRSRSRSRFRSRTRERESAPAPVFAAGTADDDLWKPKVVDGPTLRNGDRQWQAEVVCPTGTTSMNANGRARTMCIRGPFRPSEDQALEDAKEFEEATKSGLQALRDAANRLRRAKRGQGAN
mmetsp:Transcript_127789/g.367879  ORF Transcript_127789/g.367879 Transcript_127789/m.367879 type:complete len:197 (+) Transcript_127789:113-703(+)